MFELLGLNKWLTARVGAGSIGSIGSIASTASISYSARIQYYEVWTPDLS